MGAGHTLLTDNGILAVSIGKLSKFNYKVGDPTSVIILFLFIALSMFFLTITLKKTTRFVAIGLCASGIIFSIIHLHYYAYILTNRTITMSLLEQTYDLLGYSRDNLKIIKNNEQIMISLQQKAINKIYEGNNIQKYGFSTKNTEKLFYVSLDTVDTYMKLYSERLNEQQLLDILNSYQDYHTHWLTLAETGRCTEDALANAHKDPETTRLKQLFYGDLVAIFAKIDLSQAPSSIKPNLEPDFSPIEAKMEGIDPKATACKIMGPFYQALRQLPPSVQAAFMRGILERINAKSFL